MSFPGIIRRLFANEGAGPLLRKEIIPFGTTEGTICEGNDSRLADWAEVRAALKKELALLQAQRLQSIGVPKFWTSTELPDSDHCWPDGSLVLFADRPEFKAKYDAGGFAGMLLPAGSSNETIAANLGKWVEHPKGLGLYAPQLGEQFFRAWTGGWRGAGSSQSDAMQNITGAIWDFPVTAPMTFLATSGAFTRPGSTESALLQSLYSSMNEIGYGDGVTLDVSRVVRTSTENRPVNVAVPTMLYLGIPA